MNCVLLLLFILSRAVSQVIDLRTHEPVGGVWFEVGSSIVSDEWTTIESKRNYSQPAIFLSLPLTFDGKSSNHPLQIRVSDIERKSGRHAFRLKLLSTNDSYCSKQWWIPGEYSYTFEVSWLIVEEGGYVINGTQLVIGSAEVSGYVTKVDWEFSFGTSCHYPSQQSDDDYAPGGLFTLQTMHNVDTYLTARTTEWWHKGETNKCSYAWYTGRFFLEPHDGYPLDEKFLLKTESLAYLLFQSNSLVIDCLSGYRLEIGTIFGLTDQPTLFSSKYPIDPKVDYVSIFGSVVGYRGGDSFVIRAYYDNDSTSPYFYLQEDQCSDQEVTHLPEIASILIISNSSSMCSGDPHVTLYSNAPTTLPSSINNAQSFVPTVSLLSRKNSGEKKKSLLLLSILLPIIIVTVIGIVVVVARAYFVAGKGDLIPLSDDSGNNLVFDT